MPGLPLFLVVLSSSIPNSAIICILFYCAFDPLLENSSLFFALSAILFKISFLLS
jgi:hypothetical protein